MVLARTTKLTKKQIPPTFMSDKKGIPMTFPVHNNFVNFTAWTFKIERQPETAATVRYQVENC